MMSLVKMAPSAWRYYAEEVATGREDYYALGAERLGLFLRAGRGVPRGRGCRRRRGLPRAPLRSRPRPAKRRPPRARVRARGERTVAGFALTFSPPKSVSVLWALADEPASAEVLASHDAVPHPLTSTTKGQVTGVFAESPDQGRVIGMTLRDLISNHTGACSRNGRMSRPSLRHRSKHWRAFARRTAFQDF